MSDNPTVSSRISTSLLVIADLSYLKQLLPRYATLSSLPDELLQAIIDLLGDAHFRMPPLTKRLLAYYRRQQYRDVKIKTHQVFPFIRSISSNPGLGALVHSLEIKASKLKKANQIGASIGEFDKAFASFVNLVDLQISSGSSLACEAFLRSNSTQCAPRLKRLHLDSKFPSLRDPFAIQNFVETSKRRALSSLTFHVQRVDISSIPPATLTQSLSFPSVSTLVLKGPLSTSSSSTLLVATASPSYLKLEDTSKASDLCTLLSSAQSSNVKTLILGGSISVDPQDLTKQLSRFTQLDTLELIGSACPIGRPFYTALRKLPLVKLTFGRGADVSAAEVKSLISGKRKHATLKEVVLENIEAKYGEDDEVESKWDHDFVLPKFTKKFTKKGLQNIIDAAGDQKDVKLSGCTAEAIDILEYFNERLEIGKEKADVRAYWKSEGHSDGDFEEYYSRCH